MGNSIGPTTSVACCSTASLPSNGQESSWSLEQAVATGRYAWLEPS